MASLYERDQSPFIWIRYKDASGAWRSRNTGFRKDSLGDKKQAQLLEKKTSLEEMISKPVAGSGKWEHWAAGWMQSKWGVSKTTTADRYRRFFFRWMDYFRDNEITTPAALKHEHIDQYFAWRKKRNGNRNTAIHEIKFLKQMMDAAIARGYATRNPAVNLKLKKSAQPEKVVWSDAEVANVLKTLEEQSRFEWMHVAFLMGYYQAARLRQCAVPLSGIDFDRRLITYPSIIVKGGKAFSHPIDSDFLPILAELVEYRRNQGRSTLCDIPGEDKEPVSVQIRKFLNSLGLQHLCHHGLRATWITRAAKNGVNEALVRRFVNHSSTQIHQVYQKIQGDDLLPMLDAFALMREKSRALPAS